MKDRGTPKSGTRNVLQIRIPHIVAGESGRVTTGWSHIDVLDSDIMADLAAVSGRGSICNAKLQQRNLHPDYYMSTLQSQDRTS